MQHFRLEGAGDVTMLETPRPVVDEMQHEMDLQLEAAPILFYR